MLILPGTMARICRKLQLSQLSILVRTFERARKDKNPTISAIHPTRFFCQPSPHLSYLCDWAMLQGGCIDHFLRSTTKQSACKFHVSARNAFILIGVVAGSIASRARYWLGTRRK